MSPPTWAVPWHATLLHALLLHATLPHATLQCPSAVARRASSDSCARGKSEAASSLLPRAANGGTMNFFSSLAFLQAAAEAFYAGRRHRIEDVEVDGRVFRVLTTGRSHVVTRLPFLDFLEPVVTGGKPTRRMGYLPRVSIQRVSVEVWHERMRAERHLVAPYIDWSCFDGWERFWKARERLLSIDVPRKRRKLAREIGELRFAWHLRDQRLLLQLMEWKSEQYRANGYPDLFRVPGVRRLFLLLLEAGVLSLSALFAADRPVALHAGVTFEGRFLYWLPAYDAKLARTSPGTLHLIEMLRHSCESGARIFDFLLGDEAYKWHYATHVACVGPMGRTPLMQRAYGGVREGVMRSVREQRRLYQALQGSKRVLMERGWMR